MADVQVVNDKTVLTLSEPELESMRELLRLGFRGLCKQEPKDWDEREELKVTAGNAFSFLDALNVHQNEGERND